MKNHDGETAVNYAASRGDLDIVTALLPYYSNYGETLSLPAAAFGGHVEIAWLFLERGVEVNQADEHGSTGLMEAAMEGHRDVVLLLLERGAAINRTLPRTGHTAIELAEKNGHVEIADLLRRHRQRAE